MHVQDSSQDSEAIAFLEHHPELDGPLQRVTIETLPFEIGRGDAANYTIYSSKVSKRHATIFDERGAFLIRDHGSTNGTFINGERITESELRHGDILHIADKEFLFYVSTGGTIAEGPPSAGTQPAKVEPKSLIRGSQSLRELLGQRGVSPLFQPIVTLETTETIGYEALLRGAHPGLSAMPGELFLLAEQCQLARDLSRLIRVVAAEDAKRLPPDTRIFFNLHPVEMNDADLLESLEGTRGNLQEGQGVVVEISEAAVTDLSTMRGIADQLRQAGIEFAYDDFGAGQARLMELVEVPPDYLKLDLGLIRDIDSAVTRRELVKAIVRVARGLGIQVIAEGIETREVADACRDLAIDLGQGYLFGRPQPVIIPEVVHEPRPTKESESLP